MSFVNTPTGAGNSGAVPANPQSGGAPSTAMSYRGPWVAANKYATNDVVTYNGHTYVCNTPNGPASGAQPTLTGSTSNSSSSTSCAVTIPATTQVGDIMLLAVGNNSSGPVSAPTGWTILEQNTFCSICTRTCQAGDPGSSVTVTSGSNQAWFMSLYTFTSTVDAYSMSSGTGTTVASPSATATVTNDSYVWFTLVQGGNNPVSGYSGTPTNIMTQNQAGSGALTSAIYSIGNNLGSVNPGATLTLTTSEPVETFAVLVKGTTGFVAGNWTQIA